MSDHELATLLREAEPTIRHRPPDADALWVSGRRRARRTRATWASAFILVVVAGVASVAVLGRDQPSRLDVADPPDAAPTSVAPPDTTADTTTDPAPVPEPGPKAGVDATASVPGFPVWLRLDRTQFTVDGDADAEAGFVPAGAEHEPVTVAIPFTLEAPLLDGGWEPVIDLYDQSGPGATTAYWQPHGSGPAWLEHTSGPWGFPLSLPTQDLPAGSYQVCAQAWRTADGPARPPVGEPPVSAADLAALLIPESSVRLCIPIELVSSGVEPLAEYEAQLATAPTMEIERFGERVPIFDADTNDLTEGPGVVPGTPRPGEPGISVVVGHRMTWSAPFLRLDELVPGDPILVADADGSGSLRFEVTGSRIVPAAGPAMRPTFGIPDDELAPSDDPTPRLRLVTMHPKYSAMERLIVDAVFVEESGG